MFNVGDRVKILPYSNDEETLTGTVTKVLDDPLFNYDVFVDGQSDGEAGVFAKALFGTDSFPFATNELVLLEV